LQTLPESSVRILIQCHLFCYTYDI